MKDVFADTFYFLALLNRRDPHHERAVTASRIPDLRIVTTEFVLLELADALCKPNGRRFWPSVTWWNRTQPSDWFAPQRNYFNAGESCMRTVPTKGGNSPAAFPLWSCKRKEWAKRSRPTAISSRQVSRPC